MSSSLPTPLLLASTVTGFISFAFTFLTLLRVTWTNLSALSEAPADIKYSFANLKSALHEERAYLRYTARYRRRRRSHSGSRHHHRRHSKGGSSYAKGAKAYLDSDEGAAQWRVISDTVRRLCRQFEEIERPFLRDAAAQGLGSGNGSGEKGSPWAEDEREYVAEGYINDYSDLRLNHRLLWLWKKGQVADIRDGLMRVQIRRISQESTFTMMRLSALEDDLKDLRLIPGPGLASEGSDETDRDERNRTERVHVRRSYHNRAPSR